MILRRIGITYAVALVVFLAVDSVWLKYIALDFYKQKIGHLIQFPPNFAAAAAFYLLFVAGILVFGVRPGQPFRTLGGVVGLAALYGFFTYATYDLTNMATLKDWPLVVTVVDMLWGSFLCAVVAGTTFLVERWLCGE